MDKLLLKKAIARTLNKLVFYEDCGMFSYIYPFTTENISGYIDLFDFQDKKTAVIGSSGDQIINIRMKGCKDITLIDICPYAKPYFYLKKAGLMALDYEKFLKYFCYEDYPKVFKNNQNAFNISSWNDIFPILRELDNDSFCFWKSLFDRVNPYKVRLHLFSLDEDRYEVLKEANLYLKNEDTYNEAKKLIEDVDPKFIQGNIFNIELPEEYDNILLSNLAQYYSLEEHKGLLDKLSPHLNENGKILVSYLYGTSKDYINDDGRGIYDIKLAKEVLGDYITIFEDFVGIQGLKFKTENLKDSVMIYQKTRLKK